MERRAFIVRMAPLFAGLALASAVQAGPGRWTITGPDGGQVTTVVADATDPDRAVALGRGGIFRTLDGGASWQRHQQGMDYSYGHVLHAGRSSERIYAAISSRQVLRGTADANWQPTGLLLPAGEWIRDLAIQQDNDAHLVVLTTNNQIWTSHNAGGSFAQVATSGIPAVGITHKVAYVSASRLYAVFQDNSAVPFLTHHLLRSDDGGASWSVLAQVWDGYQSFTMLLAASDSNSDRLYVGTPQLLRRSDDGGVTLIDCAVLPSGDFINAIAIEPGEDGRVWAGGRRGLYRSTDACASWTAYGAGLSSDGMRPDAVASIALASDFAIQPRIFVGTVSGGLYRSDDGGLNFTMQSQGFNSHNIRALAAHPAQPGHLWVGHGDAVDPSGTVWRSTDAATSWQRSNTGLNALHLRGITVDPTTATAPDGPHLYGVGSSLWSGAPSGYVMDGGIYKSVDGGLSWNTFDNGLPATYVGVSRYIGTVRSAVLDPRSCALPPAVGPCTDGPLQTVYVIASGRPSWATGTYAAARVYKSTDAGASWNASEGGLPLPADGACSYSQIAVPLVIDPSDPQTLYLGLSLAYNTLPECSVPNVSNGIFKSTDGGNNWVHSSNGLPRLGGAGSSHYSVLTLALAPSQPQRLYAAAMDYDYNSRIFRSDDGGTNWVERSVGVIGQDVRNLLVDPTDPDIVYAAAAGGGVGRGGVYRSADGGLTWDSISLGIEGVSVTTLMADPHETARLYAGTTTGVAEYTQLPDGDSDGVPSEIENQAPNGGDGNLDGVADSQQSHVASLPGMSAPARGGDSWVTLWVEPLEGGGTCARINNMQVLDAAALPADIARGGGVTLFEDGVVRFDLPDCQRADVHVRFHGADHADRNFGWRNYGPQQPGDIDSMAWYDFASASRAAPDTWTLRIEAGEQGDWLDNGEVIRFAGGVGYLNLSLFSDGFEAMD